MGNPKVFRLHETGPQNIRGWGCGSTPIVNEIIDPNAATAAKEITSIPSPFARIDLMKNAFMIVSDPAIGLEGDSSYHKLVSDCLDVGQIFFYIDKYRSVIKLIEWNSNTDLTALRNSENPDHRRLGETYNTFLLQDSDSYNFNRIGSIYMLHYTGPGANSPLRIIGATSPATMFFTTANDLSSIGANIDFGNGDHPFDNQYVPLYKRDPSYVEWLWSYKVSIENFASDFPEFDNYLNVNFAKLPNDIQDTLRDITPASYESNYSPIIVSGQNAVSILGNVLRKQIVKIDSDFEIKPTKQIEGKIPLCLPTAPFAHDVHYVTGNWQKTNNAPESDPRPLNQRTLPFDGSLYPYLTSGDFLEDRIVKIPYKLNVDHYFDGNDSQPSQNSSFLLPLKPLLFDYFSVEDIKGSVCGKPMVEMSRLAGGSIKVILRIPIKAQDIYIQYEKLYVAGKDIDIREFTVGLFPPVAYPDVVEPYYSIAVFDSDSVSSRNNPYSIVFFDEDNHEIAHDGIIRRNRNSNPDGDRIEVDAIDSVIYILKKRFSYLQVCDETLKAVVIPEFLNNTGLNRFRFAVDLGTTNIHVEYSVNGNPSQPLDITKKDTQFQLLHIIDPKLIAWDDALWSFLPDEVSSNAKWGGFPLRTAMTTAKNTNWQKAVFAFGNVNMSFIYGKREERPYNDNITNIKWLSDTYITEKYIENLLLVIRNKVLLNGGDLTNTQLIWFYPVSMTQGQLDRFRLIWSKLYKQYICTNPDNLISMSESSAPYYYYLKTQSAVSDVVTIDIGGETSDILIVENKQPKYLTSFRFGANSIFGDGYKQLGADTNGYIIEYYGKIKKILDDNSLDDLGSVLNSLYNKKQSENIISFFFSLASNHEIKTKNLKIDFSEMLINDRKSKYPILLFYTAIIYHVAQIMKAKGLAMPHHLTFSGYGAKTLDILTSNNRTLSKFTKLIFERVYGEQYPDNDLIIIRPDNAKELTGKGGLMQFKNQDIEEIQKLKTVLLGTDGTTFTQFTYGDIDENMRYKIVSNIVEFYDFFFDLDNDFSFYSNFNIDTDKLKDIKEKLMNDKRNLITYFQDGVDIRNVSNDTKIEDSLFFYPLVGELNDLAEFIYRH